jgi:hypothetical protein
MNKRPGVAGPSLMLLCRNARRVREFTEHPAFWTWMYCGAYLWVEECVDINIVRWPVLVRASHHRGKKAMWPQARPQLRGSDRAPQRLGPCCGTSPAVAPPPQKNQLESQKPGSTVSTDNPNVASARAFRLPDLWLATGKIGRAVWPPIGRKTDLTTEKAQVIRD